VKTAVRLYPGGPPARGNLAETTRDRPMPFGRKRTNPRSLATHKTRHIKEGNAMREVVLVMNTTLNGKVDDLVAWFDRRRPLHRDRPRVGQL
jgi:hypothetical protein